MRFMVLPNCQHYPNAILLCKLDHREPCIHRVPTLAYNANSSSESSITCLRGVCKVRLLLPARPLLLERDGAGPATDELRCFRRAASSGPVLFGVVALLYTLGGDGFLALANAEKNPGLDVCGTRDVD